MKERVVWQTSDKDLEAHRVCIRDTAQPFLRLG